MFQYREEKNDDDQIALAFLWEMETKNPSRHNLKIIQCPPG